jgi:exocyst complex component 7
MDPICTIYIKMLKIFKLEQNLNKTHQISVRMTGMVLLRILRIATQSLSAILNGFDTRLAKLEKSILPLYNSSQVLTRRANSTHPVHPYCRRH